ncbi:RHS repeat-associated core domain-containing protein, partial [Streptomyces sp. NPDC097640]|uniref:RHS repeat-associated core domain-containing protein n=1 Tax=Streptomyces sp. NPDC097640 TaxID=3157229 RepID=UPI00332C4712
VYDDWGLPVEVREPNGAIWRHTYDHRGARTSTSDPSGATTHYAYDGSGHLSSVTDPLGHTTQVTTDAAGLPVTVTDPLGHTTRIRRGPHGRITAVTDPLGHTTRHGWTIEGRPAWREGPDGAREVWQWDTEGNLAHHTDKAGHTTTHTHTHFDVPATRTDPDGATYTFTHDTELRLTQVTNPQGDQWRYEYDTAGRLVAETDFNGATRTYERDAAGRLTARTNALGETLRYTLDATGRVIAQRDEATGEVTRYAYDPSGALRHVANADAELTWERDPVGRVVSEALNGRTTTYAYDAAGNRTHRTTPSGLTSAWTHEATGRPATLTTAGHTLAFTHDAAGRETRRATGDVTLTQGWDGAGRLATQSLSTASQDLLLQHRTYTYRPDGYVTEIRELTTGTRDFTLDRMGRVTGVQAHGWSEKYAYDAAGNQTHATAPDHPTTGDRAYRGTLIRRAGRTTYEHDAAGRLIRKTRKLLNGRTRTWTYTWNAEDRLTHATTPGGEEWTYTYDPLGRRIAKTGPAGTSLTFTWDGTRLAEQATHDGAITTWDYTPGTHRPLTQTDREPGSTRFHAVVTDPTGTPTELIAPDGHLAWQHRTTLWGTALPTPPDATDCPLRFPGQYADPETGLHYNFHRYYDPETARYLTPDPLGLAPAPSPQAYVRNPHTWQDPLGLEGCGDKQPPLNPLHPGSSLDKSSLEFWRKQDTEDIVWSLRPGAHEPLIVKPDGTVMNGNTRVSVLRSRGYDVDSLPRESYGGRKPMSDQDFWDMDQ